MFNHTKIFILLSLILISPAGNAFPSDMKVMSDIPYGMDVDQALDIYIPDGAKDAPVIFMIHGGGWRGEDKANIAEVKNKVAHWVTKGFLFISTNYRTLPKIGPIGQAKDIEAALLFSQQNVGEWGGSPEKFILMGHSSGAHLVALVSSKHNILIRHGITPWLGTVSMDISAYDIVKRMTSKNPSEHYREVFGDTFNSWEKASPSTHLQTKHLHF